MNPSSADALTVVSIVEGTYVTGPIKPLLMFASHARRASASARPAQLSLITTVRDAREGAKENSLLATARSMAIPVDVARERRAWDTSVVAQIAAFLHERRPAIVETHDVKCHFLLAQALLWGKVRRTFTWLAYHHGYTRTSAKVRLYQQLDRWSLRRPDRVVTLCRPFADELVAKGIDAARISVLSNAIASQPASGPDEIAALRRTLAIGPEERILLCIGRLSAEKGHGDLLAAFAMLRQRMPGRQLRLLVIGDGPERMSLEQIGRREQLPVSFLGHQSHVQPYYSFADVFVLPSHSEGSPLVLLEAMSAALPIVATRVGGVPELVSDGVSAVLVPPRSPVELAGAVERLLNDERSSREMGQHALRRAQERSPDAYARDVFALYDLAQSASQCKA